MRVANLSPGKNYIWKNYTMQFVKRISGRQPVSIFICPEFAGLNGNADKGIVGFSDYDLRSIKAQA